MRNYVSDFLCSSLSLPSRSLKILSLTRMRHKVRYSAVTLVEVLIVLAIVGTLAAIGVPAYNKYIDKARATQVFVDIGAIQQRISVYAAENETLPESLDQAIGPVPLVDPWGHPYEYLKIAGKPKREIQAKWRKDHFEVPLNTDYDLYSMGKDGKSQPPLTAEASRDDIVRACNGAFVGLASEY